MMSLRVTALSSENVVVGDRLVLIRQGNRWLRPLQRGVNWALLSDSEGDYLMISGTRHKVVEAVVEMWARTVEGPCPGERRERMKVFIAEPIQFSPLPLGALHGLGPRRENA